MSSLSIASFTGITYLTLGVSGPCTNAATIGVLFKLLQAEHVARFIVLNKVWRLGCWVRDFLWICEEIRSQKIVTRVGWAGYWFENNQQADVMSY